MRLVSISGLVLVTFSYINGCLSGKRKESFLIRQPKNSGKVVLGPGGIGLVVITDCGTFMNTSLISRNGA